jgi:hypothetical protein
MVGIPPVSGSDSVVDYISLMGLVRYNFLRFVSCKTCYSAQSFLLLSS